MNSNRKRIRNVIVDMNPLFVHCQLFDTHHLLIYGQLVNIQHTANVGYFPCVWIWNTCRVDLE